MNSYQNRQKRDGEKYQMFLENVHIFLTVWEQSMGSIYESPNFLAVVQWILTTSVIFLLLSRQLPIQITNLHTLTLGLTENTATRLFFQETSLFKLLIRNKLHIPPSGPLFSSDTENFPFVFVGDEVFSLSENLTRPSAGHNLMLPYAGHNLMLPYAGHNLSEKQRIISCRLCRARRYVECAFGILSNKWGILHTALNVSKEISKGIVKACVPLHNLVRNKDGYRAEEIYVRQNWSSVNRAAFSRPRRSASDVRDRFADYFVVRERTLPWQMNKL